MNVPKTDYNRNLFLSYISTTKFQDMIIQGKSENDGTELLFGASSGNSDTASTHYLKVEPIPNAITNNTTNIKSSLVFNSPKEKQKIVKNQETYECDLCQKQFNQKKSLAMHFAMVHRERKEFNCQYCPKRYTNLKLLEKHVIAHGNIAQRQSSIIIKIMQLNDLNSFFFLFLFLHD